MHQHFFLEWERWFGFFSPKIPAKWNNFSKIAVSFWPQESIAGYAPDFNRNLNYYSQHFVKIETTMLQKVINERLVFIYFYKRHIFSLFTQKRSLKWGKNKIIFYIFVFPYTLIWENIHTFFCLDLYLNQFTCDCISQIINYLIFTTKSFRWVYRDSFRSNLLITEAEINRK